MKNLNKRYSKHWNFKLTHDQKLKVKIEIFMILHKVIGVYIFKSMFQLNMYHARKKIILGNIINETARNKKDDHKILKKHKTFYRQIVRL